MEQSKSPSPTSSPSPKMADARKLRFVLSQPEPISQLWLSRSVVVTDILVECYSDANKFFSQMSANGKAKLDDIIMLLYAFGRIYLTYLTFCHLLTEKVSFVIIYATKIIDCI